MTGFKAQKRRQKIKALEDQNGQLLEQLRKMEIALAKLQFMLACVIHQGGGIIEIRDETRDHIAMQERISFVTSEERMRRVHTVKVDLEERKESEEMSE